MILLRNQLFSGLIFVHMLQPQRKLFLLGPQPEYASLKTVLSRLELNGPVALITAGWETEEEYDQELRQAIGVECHNLKLFNRTEQLFADDPDLIQTLQARQDELRHLRDAYNGRLFHLLKAARQIIRRHDDLIDLDAERESAIEMVRQLDRQYFVRTSQIIDDYEEQLKLAQRPLVVAHRREVAGLLRRSSAILISGGHVAIILNRLRIFGILETSRELPIVAWSGGAMALADQVVFFHDSPPQGAGNPEILRAGMGLFHDLLPLPDARTRLNLEDTARVALFARRFDSFRCAMFDETTILERRDERWLSEGSDSVSRLGHAGNVVGLDA